jgi:hypothetical protein
LEKFRHDRKIPAVEIGKRPEKKIAVWWKIFLRGRDNVFRFMETVVLQHPSYRPVFHFLFCIGIICHAVRISARGTLVFGPD